MRWMPPAWRGRLDERGAALVETALIVPVLVTLLFGIIDFGSAYNEASAVKHGAREGARQAVVGEFGADLTCPTSGLTPSPIFTSSKKVICLTKDRVGLPEADTRVKIIVSPLGYLVASPVTVCVMHPADSLTGFFGPVMNGKIHKAKAQMRIEDLFTILLESTQEAALPGHDWSWCTIT